MKPNPRVLVANALAIFAMTLVSCSSTNPESGNKNSPTTTTVDTRVKNAPLNWSINPPTLPSCAPHVQQNGKCPRRP